MDSVNDFYGDNVENFKVIESCWSWSYITSEIVDITIEKKVICGITRTLPLHSISSKEVIFVSIYKIIRFLSL